MAKEQQSELTTAEKKKQQKRDLILESAKVVFSKKGLIDATMKDIIEECGISRGGIYLYFRSVDEIFLAVLEQRSKRKFDDVREMIMEQVPFETILNKYFSDHRKRLLHSISDGMLRAVYEYYYTRIKLKPPVHCSKHNFLRRNGRSMRSFKSAFSKVC